MASDELLTSASASSSGSASTSSLFAASSCELLLLTTAPLRLPFSRGGPPSSGGRGGRGATGEEVNSKGIAEGSGVGRGVGTAVVSLWQKNPRKAHPGVDRHEAVGNALGEGVGLGEQNTPIKQSSLVSDAFDEGVEFEDADTCKLLAIGIELLNNSKKVDKYFCLLYTSDAADE